MLQNLNTRHTLEQLRFEYERYLFEQIQQRPEIQAWQQAAKHHNYYHLHQQHLLGTAVQITDNLFPDLNEVYQECLARINPDLQGHLYVHQASNYNASVYSQGQQFDMLLTSALVKDFKPSEMAFVIGHELGHVLFEHPHIPAQWLLSEESRLPVDDTLMQQLFQWSRAAEISADRVGFLACGDLSSAANAFFRMASGLQLDDATQVVRALRHQYEEIRRVTERFKQGSNSTHPLIPIRFKSLELISLDLLTLRNTRKPINTEDLATINRAVQLVLMQTEPSMPDVQAVEPEMSAQTVSLLVLCLLFVAVSDGDLGLLEEEFIRAIIEESGYLVQLDNILMECRQQPVQFQRQVLQEIADYAVTVEQMQTILRHCVIMMQFFLNNQHLSAMQCLCQTLQQPLSLVEKVVAQVGR